ncbi:Adaptor protein complex 3 (AP-3), beta subunit [Blattamonas nauphoetae]|uniref:AP-3 complex subunit beta n=1 Tax=Blattamonas nauphoetae TaxID=2049346 RepID=A0ABQ9XIK3_9EUKA|nr:Adaptor protein complex 3 (AP-3), beta subunit [Blattamonas nauphoetae]
MTGLDNTYYTDLSPSKVSEIKFLLDSLEPMKEFEALKRLCAFSSKGFDVSEFFPQVVKAIITQNLDVKRLIYQFIIINSKKQPDLVLLCVDKLHKDATENNNPLIRGLALRTLSSLNAPEIIQVLAHDISKGAHDPSPFVKKAAALAIPKLVTLDESLRDTMIELIGEMLAERSTIVLGPVLAAFNIVCPSEFRLLHKHFRNIVHVIVDLDQWSQIIALKIFLNYARNQFPSPFIQREEPAKKSEKKGDDSSESEESDNFENFLSKKHSNDRNILQGISNVDPDLRFLLTSVQTLLMSANPGVVLGVVALYYYCAPETEFIPAARAVTRLVFDNTPSADLALKAVASMAIARPHLFSAVYKDFFVFNECSLEGKKMRLNILSHIATDTNARAILSEFEYYVHSKNKEFVCATIRAIYGVAVHVPSVIADCMRGVMGLLCSSDEAVVSEAVMCVKNLIQQQTSGSLGGTEENREKEEEMPSWMKDTDDKKKKKGKKAKKEPTPEEERAESIRNVLLSLISLLPSIRVPLARSSIVWMIGTYCHLVPHHSPDVLRRLVSTFKEEDTETKLQILTLAAKIYLHTLDLTEYGKPDHKRVFSENVCDVLSQLFSHVHNLARFDRNTEVREKARFYRPLLTSPSALFTQCLLNDKPVPTSHNETDIALTTFVVGTLSHAVELPCPGYHSLEQFPQDVDEEAAKDRLPPPTTLIPVNVLGGDDTRRKGKKGFYESDDSDESTSEETDSDSYDTTSSDESSTETSSDESESTPPKKRAPPKKKGKKQESSSEESTEESSSESSSEPTPPPKKSKKAAEKEKPAKKTKKEESRKPAQSDDLLLQLTQVAFNSPSAPSTSAFITAQTNPAAFSPLAALFAEVTNKPLFHLTKVASTSKTANSNLSIDVGFTRKASVFDSEMQAVKLFFLNEGKDTVETVSLSGEVSEPRSIRTIPPISFIPAQSTAEATLAVNFADSTSELVLSLTADDKTFTISFSPPSGELLHPLQLTKEEFFTYKAQLSGMMMHKISFTLPVSEPDRVILEAVTKTANVGLVVSDDPNVILFAGAGTKDIKKVLIEVNKEAQTLAVHAEDLLVGEDIVDEIHRAIQESF